MQQTKNSPFQDLSPTGHFSLTCFCLRQILNYCVRLWNLSNCLLGPGPSQRPLRASSISFPHLPLEPTPNTWTQNKRATMQWHFEQLNQNAKHFLNIEQWTHYPSSHTFLYVKWNGGLGIFFTQSPRLVEYLNSVVIRLPQFQFIYVSLNVVK